LQFFRTSSLAIAALFVVGFSGKNLAQTPGNSHSAAQPPLLATLEVPMDTGRLTNGAAVFASVKIPWKSPNCILREGATIYGHVVGVQSKGNGFPDSRLTVIFDKADCNDKRGIELPLALYAIIDPIAASQQRADREGHLAFGSVQGPSTTAGSTLPNIVQGGSLGGLASAPEALSLKSGQLIGFDKVKMIVGAGDEGGSVLESPQKNLHIGMRSDLVLVLLPPRRSSIAKEILHMTPPEEAPTPAPAPPPPPPVDETEICSANCSAVADTVPTGAVVDRNHGDASISLTYLGYKPKVRPELEVFDHESTVTYMSADEILVTFDLHRLRVHSGEAWNPSTRRKVRAVLLDAHTYKVKRIVDWTVAGEGQYLWNAGPGQVLVLQEGALYRFGAGLRKLSTIPIVGDVRWVASTPSGAHIAVGLQHERHTKDVHQRIASLSGVDPEEDLEVVLVDSNTKKTVSSSTLMHVPVLAESGEIFVKALGSRRWQISEVNWEFKTRTVATVSSGCEPQVSASAQNTLFVLGCTSGESQRWYRVLDMNGHTLLKGAPSTYQIEQRAISAGPDTFAIRTVSTVIPTFDGRKLRADAMLNEKIGIFRMSDGRRVFGADTLSYPQSVDSFAVSPDGSQLALLTGRDVEFYDQKGDKTPPVKRP
jgi:hypothetical protein